MHFGADDGGGNGLVFTETSWQRRGLRGNRGSGFGCFSLSRLASLLIYFSLFIYSFVCLFSFPCARRRERDVCRIAVRRRGSGPVCQHSGRRFLLRWQVLLGSMNDILPGLACYCFHRHSKSSSSSHEEFCAPKLLMGSNSSCCQNCQWTAAATKTFKRAFRFFFFFKSINQRSGLSDGNYQFNTSTWCFKDSDRSLVAQSVPVTF